MQGPNILIIGAGGIGGYFIPHFLRMLYNVMRLASISPKYLGGRAGVKEARVVIADPDIVEYKNIVRQNFTLADVGKTKSKVMYDRYSHMVASVPVALSYYDTGKVDINYLINNSFNIVIDCVDNKSTRYIINQYVKARNNIIWLSMANGLSTGQVILSASPFVVNDKSLAINVRGSVGILTNLGTVRHSALSNLPEYPSPVNTDASVSLDNSFMLDINNLVESVEQLEQAYTGFYNEFNDIFKQEVLPVLSAIVGQHARNMHLGYTHDISLENKHAIFKSMWNTNTIVDLFPEEFSQEAISEEEEAMNRISCGDVVVSQPQTMMANLMAATYGLNMMYKILAGIIISGFTLQSITTSYDQQMFRVNVDGFNNTFTLTEFICVMRMVKYPIVFFDINGKTQYYKHGENPFAINIDTNKFAAVLSCQT